MTKLTLVDRAFQLKETAFFSLLDLELLLSVAEKMHALNFSEKQTVFEKGEEVHHLYYLVQGKILLTSEKATFEIKAGQFFGDEPVLSQTAAQYQAQCISDCQVLTLSKRQLLAIMGKCPSVSFAFLNAYANNMPLRVPA